MQVDANPHHQRALDLLHSNVTFPGHNETRPRPKSIDIEEGIRSAWSPDHEFEIDLAPPMSLGAAARATFYHDHHHHHDHDFGPAKALGGELLKSLKAVVLSSWINSMLLAVPVAWTAHFMYPSLHWVIFVLCFVSLIPLSHLLDYGAHNLAWYCKKQVGSVVVETLSNAVLATLAILLLMKCQLRLLQSLIIGIMLLRFLLLPGVSLLCGGAAINLKKREMHATHLHVVLAATGVVSLLIPISYFSALDRGYHGQFSMISDTARGELLQVSRGIGGILVFVYAGTRFLSSKDYQTRDAERMSRKSTAPSEGWEDEEDAEVNIWICLFLIPIVLGLSIVTVAFLAETLTPLQEAMNIEQEWFGLILLPLIAFPSDALKCTTFFVRTTFFRQNLLSTPPSMSPHRHVQASAQFLLFWMPLLVFLAWITRKPFLLLFDLFEVALLVGACFLFNYAVSARKVNWAEGTMLASLYVMVAVAAWFYPGQPEMRAMLSCSRVDAYVVDNAPALSGNITTNVRAQTEHRTLTEGREDDASSRKLPTDALKDILPTLNEGTLTSAQKIEALFLLYNELLQAEAKGEEIEM